MYLSGMFLKNVAADVYAEQRIILGFLYYWFYQTVTNYPPPCKVKWHSFPMWKWRDCNLSEFRKCVRAFTLPFTSLCSCCVLGLNGYCAHCVLLKSLSWDESEIPFPNGLLDGLEPSSMGQEEDLNLVRQNNAYKPTFNPFFKGLIQHLFQQILALQNPNFLFLFFFSRGWLKMDLKDAFPNLPCICFE